jgi:hypothetical protein
VYREKQPARVPAGGFRMNPLNAFVRPHRDWIRFGYSCFDRIVGRTFIPACDSLGTVVHFLKSRR